MQPSRRSESLPANVDFADFSAPIVYLQHVNDSLPSALTEVLQCCTRLTVRWTDQGDRLVAGVDHVCPAACIPCIHPDGFVTFTRVVTRWTRCTGPITSSDPSPTYGTDLGNIQLVDPQTGHLVIAVQRRFGIDFLADFASVTVTDESACGRAMRTKQAVMIPDVTTDASFAAHCEIAA